MLPPKLLLSSRNRELKPSFGNCPDGSVFFKDQENIIVCFKNTINLINFYSLAFYN